MQERVGSGRNSEDADSSTDVGSGRKGWAIIEEEFNDGSDSKVRCPIHTCEKTSLKSTCSI